MRPHQGHISQRFNQEIEDLRARLLIMGGLVEAQIGRTLAAMQKGDADLAEAVLGGDAPIDALETSVDELCAEVIARRQPAASDLRLIMTTLRLANDIERIGDEAHRAARMVAHLIETEARQPHYEDVISMGQLVRRQLRDALDCLARMDPACALEIAGRDQEVDRRDAQITRDLVARMQRESAAVPRLVDLLWVVRCFERIGDHARNICRGVSYMVNGRQGRHRQPGLEPARLS